MLAALALYGKIAFPRYLVVQASLTTRADDTFGPSQDEIGELPHLGLIGRTVCIPIAIDFENASLIAFELLCELGLGVGILPRADIL